MKKIFISICILLAVSVSAFSQLTVVQDQAAQDLAEILSGPNITVTNASISGDSRQNGSFLFDGDGLEVSSGVILSTGKVTDAVGPNTAGGTSTGFGNPGDPLLDALSDHNTLDAVVFQFDFEVQSDMIEFKYIFLSEEYNEYVNSGFNDVFAFYISGPGITGEENLAVVPGTTVPVTINTINSGSYWQYYVNNDTGTTNIEFDGFTTLMTAKKEGLIPCETYTLKLMIADASDQAYDSGVLLEENSLVQANVSATANTYSDNDIALEGCIQANFTFQLDSAMNEDTYIPIEFAGTATNGVDYAFIDPMIIIPAGQTSATLVIDSYTDGLDEGQETVELIFSPSACSMPDTITLYIDDYQTIEFTTTASDLDCNGNLSGEATFDVTGGLAPYMATLTDSVTLEVNTYSSFPVTGLSAGTYFVEISDGYGCQAEDIVFGDIFDGGPIFIPDGTGAPYTTTINISGFGAAQTLTSVNQIESICFNMEHSRIGELEILLEAPNGTQIVLKQQPGGAVTNMGEPCAIGPADAGNDDTSPGVGYDYCFTTSPQYGTMVSMANVNSYDYVTACYGTTESDKYLPAGSYEPYQTLEDLVGVPLNGDWSIIIRDEIPNNNGWVFNWSISLSADQADSVFTITEPILPEITTSFTNPDCGASNGEIDITITDGFTPYDFDWSNDETSEDIFGLSSGSYSLDLTDANTCVYHYDFNLSNNGSLILTADSYNETCSGAADGSLDLSVSGGTAPFIFDWSDGFDEEDNIDLQTGDYTVTVSDVGGCLGIETFFVDINPQIIVTGTVVDENCGDHEGYIDISIEGGESPYSFEWSNAEVSEDIDELTQDDYSVIVYDANMCSAIETFSVVNYVGNCIPDCDLEILSSNITDEICGNNNGEIDLTIFTGFSPISIIWSNGATTEDLINLNAGDYTATITDAQDCELIETYSIINQTGNLAIIGISTTNETCGNAGGEIDITVSGGAMPYFFEWSNLSDSEDITGLSEGDYYVTVTDANNCMIVDNASIINESGDLTQTYGNAANELCGNASGSIDIIITGGTMPYNYDWSNGQHSEDLLNLSAGTYSCTITDQTGCHIYTPDYIVENESGDLSIDYINIDNEICSNALGDIELTISGGDTPYEFLWSNSEITQDVFNLSAGEFNCVITDNNGCSINTNTISLINESGDLTLESISTMDEICSNNQGAINLTVTGVGVPFDYSWSNGATTEDIINIGEGNYTCIITDINFCEITVNASVENDQGTLEVLNTITYDETCGNADGEIDIVVNGGTIPYDFDWNNGEASEDIIGLSEGLYSCTIIDFNGCEISTSATINNNSGDLNLDSYSLTNEICGNSEGAINLNISGTATPILFAWSNFEPTEDLVDIIAGTYTCTITDDLGCSIIAGPYVVNNSSPGMIVTNLVTVDESCGNNAGEIDITVEGGTLPLTFDWSNGETAEDITGLNADTYTYIILDDNGCSITDDVIINNNAGTLELLSYQITDEICGNALGEINITVQGGALPLVFDWSNTEITEDITNLDAGTYSVIITDDNLCAIQSIEYTINNNPGDFVLTSISVTDEVCEDASGSIDVSLTGGTMPITYNWSNSTFSQDISGLSSGVYSCTTSDANGCVLNYNATVYNNAGNLSVINSVTLDETCYESNGEIDITVDGGALPYVYLWNNGAGTEDLVGIAGGDYSCLISDANDCYITFDESIINIGGDLAVSNVNLTNEYCDNNAGVIDLSISGGSEPYLFDWSNSSTEEDISSLNEGPYTVTITDDIGCSIIETYSIINEISDLTIDDIIIVDEYCSNGSGQIDLVYSGSNTPISILWDNGSTDATLLDLPAGEYIVTITDATNCFATDNAIVINNTDGFVLISSVASDENCGDNAGAIDIEVTGGTPPYTYSWDSGQDSQDLIGLAAGTYTCSITDGVDCMLVVSETVNNITNGLDITGASLIDENCSLSNASINIDVVGGDSPYIFLWSNDSEDEDLMDISAGTYICTVTDDGGCMFVSPEYIIENIPSDMVLETIVTNDMCGTATGEIDLIITGGALPLEILWSNDEIFEDIINLEIGTYSVIVTDSDACISEISADVLFANDPDLQFDYINTTDDNCGQSMGQIEFQALVPGSYIYELNGVASGTPIPIFSNLSEGEYIVSIVQDGCRADETVFIDNITGFTAEIASVEDEYCGDGTGYVSTSVDPVDGEYTYTWSNGEYNSAIYNLHEGDYSCVISDDLGCSDELFASVVNIASFTASSIIVDEDCGNGLGSIDITVDGAIGVVDYFWSNDEISEDIDNLSAGTYTCIITDEDDCIVEVECIVNNNTNNLVVEAISGHDFCNEGQGYIHHTITGGSGNYEVIWSNDLETANIDNLTAGTYSVTITDIDETCTFIEEYIITNSGFFTVSGAMAHCSCSVCDDGSINLTITGSGSDYTYYWSNEETTEDISELIPGVYTVTVTDDWGCIIIEEFTLGFITGIEDNDNPLSIIAYPNPTNGELYVDYNFGANNYGYISVYNILGERLSYEKIIGNEGTYVTSLGDFNPGMYYLKIESLGFSKTEKIILQK